MISTKAATNHVMRNLQKERELFDTVGGSLPLGSLEDFKAAAVRHLGEWSNLRTQTIEAADYAEIWEYFKANPNN